MTTRKYNPDSPLRPRNQRKRAARLARRAKRQEKVAVRESTADHSADADAADQSYIDRAKVVHRRTVDAVRSRISRLKETIKLPFQVETLRRGRVDDVIVENIPARRRELLPDVPPRFRILCHARVARIISSGVCVFSKITEHQRFDEGRRTFIDGSWTIAPCTPAMLRGTTVQHVSRRPWAFFRRYSYEISFDGRVQPGMLLVDYDIDALTRRRRFFVTHEFVRVKGTDHENDFIRFWRTRPEEK